MNVFLQMIFFLKGISCLSSTSRDRESGARYCTATLYGSVMSLSVLCPPLPEGSECVFDEDTSDEKLIENAEYRLLSDIEAWKSNGCRTSLKVLGLGLRSEDCSPSNPRPTDTAAEADNIAWPHDSKALSMFYSILHNSTRLMELDLSNISAARSRRPSNAFLGSLSQISISRYLASSMQSPTRTESSSTHAQRFSQERFCNEITDYINKKIHDR